MRSARQLILVPVLLSFSAVGWAQCQQPRPALIPLRYDEDWSLVANPDCKKEALDDLKYIRLGRENWYLSIGGEIRYRYENYDLWVVQQLREAFPYGAAPRFLIFDRDAKYGTEVPTAIRSMKIKCVRTSLRSPWQNGFAERWVESCRHDLLDHVIALSERHLSRLLADYVGYYHDDRTHLGLEKGTPNGRARCMASGSILSHERLGGLHHRYDRAA